MLVGKRVKSYLCCSFSSSKESKWKVTSEQNVALRLTSTDVDVWRLTTDKVVTGFVWHGGPGLRQ
jgi:hypothetical protein